METLFAFDKRNYQNCQKSFRGPRNNEYYTGDYSIEPGSVIDVRAERKTVGCCSIIRLRSRTRQFFRRSWDHIRNDGTDVAVLCFVKRGRVCVSHQLGDSIATAGDFIITKSISPFTVDSQPGEDGAYELFHLTVPMQMLRRVLREDVKIGFCVPADGRKFAIAERILLDIFEDTGELNSQISQQLVESALCVLADAIKDHGAVAPERQGLADKRLQDVLRFIETHLSDSKLSVASVAAGCGISSRYLSLLLKRYGSPFSELIWNRRLQTARQWLAAPSNRKSTISEIAYRIGFKNPAHFSRMFKREFKVSPRVYRASPDFAPTLSSQPLVVDGGELRH